MKLLSIPLRFMDTCVSWTFMDTYSICETVINPITIHGHLNNWLCLFYNLLCYLDLCHMICDEIKIIIIIIFMLLFSFCDVIHFCK